MGVKDFINIAAASIKYPEEPGERKSICRWLLIDKYEVTGNQIALNEEVDFNEEAFKIDLAQIELGVPLQQITGFSFFADCKIKVSPEVLIPRPETEELVFLLSKSITSPHRILDLCTGSGCIALAMKRFFPNAEVDAWEISEAALSIAKENALKNKLQVNWAQMDALNLASSIEPKFDLIISNPPYIKNEEKAEMSKTVLNHEPHLALFVPDDEPLLFYNAIALYAATALNKGGTLAFEINKSQGQAIAALLENLNFKNIQVLDDMSDLPRFVLAEQ